MNRADLIAALDELLDINAQPGSESERDARIAALQDALPHARISDLVFHPDRDRTTGEIADEALRRERLWLDGGDAALRPHLVGQLRAALADEGRPDGHYTKVSAKMLLAGLGEPV